MLKFFTIALIAFMTLPSLAQENKIDGLSVLGTGKTFVDKQNNATMVLRGLISKYTEPIASLTISKANTEVRFYMNDATWDKFKQLLIKSRDQWDTLSPKEFINEGQVRGYRVANKRATLQLSIQGETALDKRRLDISLVGDENKPNRVFFSLTEDQVGALVEELYKVDEFLSKGK